MTFRQQAEQIISDVKHLPECTALDLIESRLKLLFAQGERAGIDEAIQRINIPELVEAMAD